PILEGRGEVLPSRLKQDYQVARSRVARTKEKRPEKSLAHDRIVELQTAITEVRNGQKTSPRTAGLLAAGLPRMAQKLAEEATEVVIEAVRGERSAVINESVDLIYNL